MKRILFFTHYAQYYGANRSLVDLVEGLQQLDYQIEIIVAGQGEVLRVLEEKCIKYHVVAFNTFVYRTNRLSYFTRKKRAKHNLHALDNIEKLARKFAPDIVYSNSSVFDIGVQLAKRIRCPHVWHIREMAELHYGYHFYPNKTYFTQALQESAALIAISQAIKKQVLNTLTLSNYHVLYDAVFARQTFDALPLELVHQRQERIIGVIGMLHPSKNQATIVKALAHIIKEYPNTVLWIIGEGQYAYTLYLKTLIRIHDLSRHVKMLGYISNMETLYPKMDIVVVASEYEGMGRTTIEGMAYQKPIVGLDSGATPELVKHKERGMIYKKNNAKNLAEAILYLLDNPDEMIRMGKAGRFFVAEHFLIEYYAKKIDEILQTV